jgi:CelD/BcsL family acetyltransferase involved in cellulose biosynthesis
VRVEIVPPRDLGRTELETWASWQVPGTVTANPFLSPGFALLAGDVLPSARVGVVTDGPTTVAFWPLGVAGPTAGPLLPRYTDLEGLVHVPGWTWRWEDLLRAAGLDAFDFHHLAGDQASGLRSATMAGSPQVEFESGGWDAYAAWMQACHKKWWRDNARKERGARQAHELIFTPCDRAPDAVAALVRQKSTQCRQLGWADVFGPRWTRHLAHAAAEMERDGGRGMLSTLRLDGVVAAATLSLEAAGTRCGWITSYDPAYSRFGPGTILTFDCLEQAASDGCRIFSFGKGDDPYKLTFATGSKPLASGSVVTSSMRGRIAAVKRVPARAALAGFDRWPAAERALRNGVRRLRRLRYSAMSS